MVAGIKHVVIAILDLTLFAFILACGGTYGSERDIETTVEPTPQVVSTRTTSPAKAIRNEGEAQRIELKNTGGWINSDPFTLESLRGQVILVDFWTFTCINCIRTLPYLKSWYRKYSGQGLTVLGIHTPEFAFEKNLNNLQEAVDEFGIKYPVVQDNEFGTWKVFHNQYWPAKYLIDKDGFIRYSHFGEGSYRETEEKIRELLIETGEDLENIPIDIEVLPTVAFGIHKGVINEGLTRELYAGFNRNFNALQSKVIPPYVLHTDFYLNPGEDVLYKDPRHHQNHYIYLEGLWRNTEESLVHARKTVDFVDHVSIRFYATTVNAVMAPVESSPFTVNLTLNGAPLEPGQAGVDVVFDSNGSSVVVVDHARMYSLVELDSYGGHELKLSSNSVEMQLFAFTFGAYQTNK